MKELNQTQIQVVAGGVGVNDINLAGAGAAHSGRTFLEAEVSNKPTPLVLYGLGYIAGHAISASA